MLLFNITYIQNMDSQTAFVSTIISCSCLIVAALAKMNHKRLRSTCCDKEVIVSLDLEDTTPKKDELIIKSKE